jgi:Ca2+-binding EF-hand superfamily protein
MKKSMLNVFLGSVAVAMMGLSIPVFAEATEEDINRFVTNCDANKDGMISKTEVGKWATAKFDKMDTGKKGMMDDKQFMAFLVELQKTDGYTGQMMSKTDLMKKVDAMFDKFDTSKKGMLDRKQAAAFLNELMKSGA